jgi:hypothetical protein
MNVTSLPVNYRLNIRGNVDDEGPEIPRGFLEVFSQELSTNYPSLGELSGSGRLELAHYLADQRNPQTARVYVNRVWQWIFGTGIVATPSDHGHLGDLPSHPELLDWLTLRFMEEGWSTKRLVKRLVLSRTFRQSGESEPEARQHDPDNRLLHHYPTRRLEAEAIRDNLLAVSGRLDPKLYGRPINPPRVAQDSAKAAVFRTVGQSRSAVDLHYHVHYGTTEVPGRFQPARLEASHGAP